jgi:hypothetical protein
MVSVRPVRDFAGQAQDGFSFLGARHGPMQTIKRLASSNDITIDYDGLNPNVLKLSVNFPTPPSNYIFSDAAITELVYDWTTTANFPPLDSRWQANPDNVTLPGSNAWSFTPGYVFPDILNFGFGNTSSTAFAFRNASWSRFRINATNVGGGTWQIFIYERPPWGNGNNDLSLFDPWVLEIDVGGSSPNDIWISPPIPPGYHWCSFRFVSNSNSGEDLRWYFFEIFPVEPSDWNTFFEDFYGYTGNGATNPNVWQTKTSSTGVAQPAIASSVTELVTAAGVNEYTTLIAPHIQPGGSQGISFEAGIFIATSNGRVEVGMTDPAFNPAPGGAFGRVFYDPNVSGNWLVDYAGLGSPIDTGTPVDVGGGIQVLRIETGAGFSLSRVYLNGNQIWTGAAALLGNNAPYLQVTDVTGGGGYMSVDYVSVNWLRRFASF